MYNYVCVANIVILRLSQASSVADMLKCACMVCDCGFVFRHGTTLLIITYGVHCHIHHCKG